MPGEWERASPPSLPRLQTLQAFPALPNFPAFPDLADASRAARTAPMPNALQFLSCVARPVRRAVQDSGPESPFASTLTTTGTETWTTNSDSCGFTWALRQSSASSPCCSSSTDTTPLTFDPHSFTRKRPGACRAFFRVRGVTLAYGAIVTRVTFHRMADPR